ncbi:MAG: PIG-L family deacetylase [Chloroflexi bacterium]|nr:PIG-L family deacetylase [Chloroflexota bacterium]
MDTPGRVLVVTPHADDAEIGCGGTVVRWAREGAQVYCVLCTDGGKGTSDPEMTPERLAAIREEEQAAAARVLGLQEVIFLRHPDGGLEDGALFRGQLVREIRRLRPDVLLTTDPFRRTSHTHRDHRMAGQVSLDACFPYARDRLHFPEHEREGLQPHKVGAILFWGTEDPQVFVDTTDTIETKIEALAKHVSQMGTGRDVGEFVKNNARRLGERAGCTFAEGFRRIEFRR